MIPGEDWVAKSEHNHDIPDLGVHLSAVFGDGKFSKWKISGLGATCKVSGDTVMRIFDGGTFREIIVETARWKASVRSDCALNMYPFR